MLRRPCLTCRLTQGNVHKKKEVVQDVTLHDLDAANARPQAGAHPSPP